MAGDDVRIGAGASLVNNTGGSEPGSLVLDAGGLSSFATLPAGNVASLLIGDGATIDGTAGSVSLIGGAIDGGNAAFSGADFTADVRNPPALGVAQRDDNGQLTAPCLEGDICLGAISAFGAVAIGQGEAAPIHFLGTGGIAGASVAISSQDTLTYGSAASPFTITASGPISLTSQSGDVALVGNALLDGGTVALSAAGPVTGNGRIRTAGDVGIDVGGSVSLDSLIAGGRLTSVAGIGGAFAPFTLPGDLTIGVLQVGADQSVQSNGSIAIGSASAGGNDLALEAAALVSLGGSSNIGDLSLSGATANFGTIAADGNIVLTATNAIAGTSATAGGALAASGASLTAQTLGSGATMALDISGPITLGSASSGAGLGVTGGDLSFAALASAGATTIATSSVSGGDIAAGTSLSISTPGAIVLGKATTGTTLSLDASTLTASTLQSGQAMSLRTTGAASLGTATSGANLDATTGDLSFTVLSSVGATTLNATKVAGGNITAGTSLAVTSAGAIGLGDASAGTTLTLDGATLSANALQSTQAMSVRSSGVANLGTATSGASLGVTTGDLAFTALTSTGATTVTASKVTGGTIAAGTSLAVTSPGAIGLTGATAVTNLSLDGAALAVTGLQAGQGLTLRSSGAATVGTAQAGTDLDIATGDLGFTALSSAGTTTVNATKVAGGDIAAGGAISVTSPGAIALGNTNAGTNLALNGASIAAATLQSGRATTLVASGASIISSATSGGDFSSTSGSVQFTAITATGDVLLDTASANGGDATSTTGAIALSSSGSATIGHLRGATDVSARATALTFAGISAGRDVSIDVTSLGGTAIAAGRDLTIRSVNDLVFGTIAAGRNLGVTASNGAITVNTDIDAGGTVALAGDAVLVKALGALNVASVSADNGDVAITTDGLLTVANATAIGDIGLTSTANSLVLGPLSAGRAPQTATAINAGGTSKGTPGAGAITLNAAQAITMQSTVDALTSLNATAGTVIDQRGLAVGKTIAYRSADIALEQSAALGQSNFTTGISLSNGGTSGAFLGDNAGGTGGYRLDNAEFARIHSGGDLMLAGGSSLSVGALAANAGTGSGGAVDGNIGANGALGLSSTGELAVAGALTLGNAGGNRLNLAGATVSVDAANGSVRLLEASGHGGTLAVIARDVLALSSAARSALVGLDAGAIDQRLAQNDGVADGRTLLEAGAITIGASGRVLIQNTAAGQTFDQRRGFVADSFTVSTTGTPLIAINGTVGGQTGLNALRAVQFTGTFDPLSTVNGCRLLTASCGTPQFDPIRGLIEEEIGEGSNLDGSDGGFGPGVLIQISRFEPVGFEAVIDEPVTGSGNDDFLAPEAGVGDGQCTAEDRTKCDKPPQRGGK